MILSHRYRLIFLKTGKTAGTSIELSLSRYCGPDDIVTAADEEAQAIRAAHGGVGPQNDLGPARLRELELRDVRRVLRTGRWPRRKRFREHISAAEVRDLVAPDVWRDYHKVAFVRNPWDRAMSSYFWRAHRHGSTADFDEWLAHRNNGLWSIISIDDDVAVDQVGRYESLEADVRAACERVGLPFDGWLPSAKGGVRAGTPHYRDFLTPAQADVIAVQCAREIEEFGYEF